MSDKYSKGDSKISDRNTQVKVRSLSGIVKEEIDQEKLSSGLIRSDSDSNPVRSRNRS